MQAPQSPASVPREWMAGVLEVQNKGPLHVKGATLITGGPNIDIRQKEMGSKRVVDGQVAKSVYRVMV